MLAQHSRHRGRTDLDSGIEARCGADATFAKIRAGASAVQLYTAMIFEGVSLIERLMERHRLDEATVAHLKQCLRARIETDDGGAILAPAGTPVSFYDGDPNAGGTLIGTVPLPADLEPGEYIDLTIDWAMTGFSNGTLFVAADDDGTGRGDTLRAQAGFEK